MKSSLMLIMSLFYICLPNTLQAQQFSLKGTLNDVNEQPISNVVCMLQCPVDSMHIQHALSNTEGEFYFPKIDPGMYRLIFTHISYEPLEVEIEITDNNFIESKPFILAEKELILDDVSVVVKRPIARLESGKMTYSAHSLSDSKIASNAFELLRHIPNIIGSGDNLKLVGVLNFSILINGVPSTLNQSQLIQALQSISASKVQKIEIMYSTPPQYNVKGASVNIVLNNKTQLTDNHPLQGELAARYLQGHKPGYGIQSDFNYTQPKYAFELSIDGSRVKNWNQNINEAIHQLKNETYNISQNDRKILALNDINFRIGAAYSPKKESSISLVYTGNFNGSKSSPTGKHDKTDPLRTD